MKIRQGFVSNSSSSSFLALACRDDKVIKTVLEKENIDSDDLYEQNIWGIYGLDDGIELFECDNEISFVGFCVEKLLTNGEPLPKIKEKFIKALASKYGLVVSADNISLSYGEWPSE